jgi:hypothetical protein
MTPIAKQSCVQRLIDKLEIVSRAALRAQLRAAVAFIAL